MRLVFITQQVDPAHPALGATVPKIAALARRVGEVVVLADGAVPDALPGNARVRTFGARTRAGRGLRFEHALTAELRGLRGGVVVAHMCPIYAVLAAPLVRPLRIPLVLWYTHWRAGRLLRAAERSASVVTSVDRRSFPLRSSKVRAIGHGIELGEFACTEHRADGALRLLALGRYSPAKGLREIVHAVAATDARLTVHGPTLTPLEREHRQTLGELVDALGAGDRIRLEGPVPRTRVPELFAGADLLVNNMRAGAPDKVVYEAAASCLPVVASNPVFDELLEPELRFARDDPDDLAHRLRAFEARDASARRELGRRLREQVAAHHSAESWAEGILAAAGRA
ncbi:MAG: glycosyltransferase family 4 protein [Actinobacteria bacterium]|nr:MAG: glycosyltransferase family 4 protein [Actinomycetota bacterium]